MGSYYFFSENFLQQNCVYKFKEFIKISYYGFYALRTKNRPIYPYICLHNFAIARRFPKPSENAFG